VAEGEGQTRTSGARGKTLSVGSSVEATLSEE